MKLQFFKRILSALLCLTLLLPYCGLKAQAQTDAAVQATAGPSAPVQTPEGWKFYKLVEKQADFTKGSGYVIAHTNQPKVARVMTFSNDSGVWRVDEARSAVFAPGSPAGKYLVVQDDSWIWQAQTHSAQTAMYNATMNQYLAANHQMQITLRDTPSDTYGYRIASSLNFAGFHEGTPDGATAIMDLEVVYQAGQFQMIKRRSTTNQAIFTYAYKEDTSIQSLSAYVDVTEGQCSVGSQDDAQTGSNVVLTVTKADGSTSTHTIPITLDMLDLDMENRYIADTHTCSVRWGGMTLCTDYQLTVISNPDIPSAATNPVVLLQNNGLIFKEVNQLLENRQYVFVHNTEGNTGYAPIAQAVDNEVTIGVGQGTIVRIPGETDNYFQVPDPAWTWVYHWRQGVSIHDMGNMLYNGGMSMKEDYELLFWDRAEGPYNDIGWRKGSQYNHIGFGTSKDAIYASLRYEDGRVHGVDRNLGTSLSNVAVIYERDTTLGSVVTYLDGNAGIADTNAADDIEPGGNIVVQKIAADGTQTVTVTPITLNMLSGISLLQRHTPGTYRCQLIVDGTVLSDDYSLTIAGDNVDNIISWDGYGTSLGGVAWPLNELSGSVPTGSGGHIPTGCKMVVYTHKTEGNVEYMEVDVTVGMLNVTAEQLAEAGTITGLTLTYMGQVVTNDFTLRVEPSIQDDYPDFPNAGSVKVDKQLDATKYNYLETGTAQINLSVAGIPTTSKANVVIILDASSSMNQCTHGTTFNTNMTDAYIEIANRAMTEGSVSQEGDDAILSVCTFSGISNKALYLETLNRWFSGELMSASDIATLKKAFAVYGYCTTSDLWVGTTEGHCLQRAVITKQALAELLEYLQQDIDGYAMDIDVAVAYFNQYYVIRDDIRLINSEETAYRDRDSSELMQPFANVNDIDIPTVISRYKSITGTNYDRGMEWAYQLLSEKQTTDYNEYLQSGSTAAYEPRQDFVLFMSDGAPYQFNYLANGSGAQWTHYCNGDLDEGNLGKYVEPEILPIFQELYHPDGKLWLAEAIKGDKGQNFKVIDPSREDSNYVNYVPGLDATMMTVTLNSFAPVMQRIASRPDYYIPTETADDIQQAFGVFGSLVTSASGSYFMDQMGDEFDLQMKNTIDVANIKDLYKSATGKWDSHTGQQTTRTIYFDNSHKNWSKVNVYTWDATGGYPTGAWPGSQMLHLGNGICAYEVPENATGIIFNDGSSQTDDLTVPTDGKNLYMTKTNSWMAYNTRTVYFDATGCSWSQIGCYTWGGSGVSTTGDWPGAEMVYLGNGIYSCEVPADATHVIFNNNIKTNGSQTGNLELSPEENCLYRYNSNTWDTYTTRTIYYDNSGSQWDTLFAYTWDERIADPNGNFTTSAWPGMEMKHLGGNIYACQVPADAENIIFNMGSDAGKTEDLTIPETEIQLNSTITVSTYELYKYSEHLHDPDTVTMDMVGKRKETQPTVLEQITFSDDGTEAYSSLIGDGKTNILIDGVICAKYFRYNTDTSKTVRIDTDADGTADQDLTPETFYWFIDNIPEDELVLSYNVYLTGTLEGLREAGSYPTNEYASLHYTNHLGNDCRLDTTSPILPWNQAVVGYAFYLVDADGNPLVNEDQHITGAFEKAIHLTQPQYVNLNYNSSENLDPYALNAATVLPEGYSLYDPEAAYYVKLYANGDGGWDIIQGENRKASTYVTGYGGVPTTQLSATAGMSTATDTFDYPAYATSSTVVWFAVRADVNAVPDTVVIDYGISVDIHVLGNDVVITDQNSVIAGIGTTRPEDADGNGIIFTGTLAEGFGNDCSVRFGTAAVRGNVVRYTPNTLQMTTEDTFYYSANYRGEKNSGFYYGAITVIPATTIYYEDSFVTFDGNWAQVGQTIGGIQDEDRQGGYSLPKIDANNVYGHDSAYENMQTWSMGSVMKATVDNGEHPEAIAEFTFTGTGFDIISYTSSNTGIMMLTVQGITDPSYHQLLMVDSYYSLSGSLYQVPIMKMQNLPYGQYWVEVYAGYSQAFDHEGDGAFDFYLDAIRIYDPANDGQGNKVIENAYVSDKEGWPSYQELRNLLISASTFDSLEENDEISGVIFIDGNPALEDDNASGKPGSEINSEIKSAIADYANFGPNNELYLAPGQAVAFRLNVDAPDENIDSIHLGLKSVGGTAVAKVYNAAVNHAAVKEQRLSSATQQYYDITKLDGNTVVIWNVGGENDAILSVTDIKTTYAHQPKNAGRIGFTINRNAAAMALSSMSAPQEVRPQLTLKYPSLSFEGEICYNVYFDAQQLNGLTDADLGLAVFSSEDTEGTVDTAMGVIYGTQQVNGLYMATTDGIPAKNMGDRLYFKAFAKLPDGSYVYSDMRSYSAVDYAVEILKTSENAALKALAVAMLNYGAQAQVFFGYNTHSLMNGVLSEEDQTLVSGFSPAGLNSLSAVDSAKAGLFQANGGFTRKYPTVFFDGAFEINYNVIPGSPVDGIVTLYCWNEYSYKAADVLTRENADWAVPMVNENGTWKACSDQIAAKDMDQTIYAAAVYESGGTRYSTGILNYSIATYCQEQTAASDSNIKALANAAATYGCAAKAYFH